MDTIDLFITSYAPEHFSVCVYRNDRYHSTLVIASTLELVLDYLESIDDYLSTLFGSYNVVIDPICYVS